MTIWSVWFYRALDPYGIKKNSIQWHGSCLGHFSIILSFWWAYSWSRSFQVTRSRKGELNFLGLGGLIHVFGSFCFKTQKMTLEDVSNCPNWTNFKIWKIQELQGTAWKWTFSTLKTPKLGHFSRYILEIVYTCTSDRTFFTYIPLF